MLILYHMYMIYVIHVIMFILTMETKFKLGLVSKRLMLYSYDWYHLMFIFQVPYKKFDKNNTSNIYHIYTCYDIFVAGGEHKCFYICYNLFSIGGEHIIYFLQGEHLCTQSVIIKKGENVGTCFDEDFCEKKY